MHCPRTLGLIKDQAYHTPSFYSPGLPGIQGDKVHKMETMTSPSEDGDGDRASTLTRSLGRTEAAVCSCHPTSTMIHLQNSLAPSSASLDLVSFSFFFFPPPLVKSILEFESPYLLWLRKM